MRDFVASRRNHATYLARAWRVLMTCPERLLAPAAAIRMGFGASQADDVPTGPFWVRIY